jgi:hypothetical protein
MGISVTFETVRRWFCRFGPIIAAGLRKTPPEARHDQGLGYGDLKKFADRTVRKMYRFKRAQKFLSMHVDVYNIFNVNVISHQPERTEAFALRR